MIKIAPSILSADFCNLGAEVKAVALAGADMVHIDVMDGHFVPNLTMGPPIIKALRSITNILFDVHLMISNPADYIKTYAEAGADIITIHYEAVKNIKGIVTEIQSYRKLAGISLLPSTPPQSLNDVIENVDLILVMSVNPGFGGQEFMKDQLPKIEYLANQIKKTNRDILLAVDGGINDITAKLCIDVGANMLIAGSFIFQDENYREKIIRLRNS